MNQYSFQFGPELIVDLFAGGGGASLGIEQAFGRPVDVCVNHDAEAVQMHMANHPRTQHYCADVFEVDPIEATKGRAVGLLWASPSCTHFSKAKGGKPLDKKIRGLSWVVVAWAKAVRPRVIILENVEEFQTWGPLDDESKPCPRRRGETFNEWLGELRALGYAVEHRELRACDYGAPTIRKRFFLIARCDGRPIVWPKQTHGKPGAIEVIKGKLKPWLTAASCIDWSLVCPSIFERAKPLADATLRRIAKGIMRYVVECAEPFIVPVTHQGFDRVHPTSEPMRTVTAAKRGEFAVCNASIMTNTTGHPGQAVNAPLNTVTTGGHHAVCTAYLDRQFGASVGTAGDAPVGTVTAGGGGKSALVSAMLAKHYTGVVGSDVREPVGTVTSVDHHSVVSANLIHMGHGEQANGQARWSHGVRDIEDPLNTVTASGMCAGLVTAHLTAFGQNAVGGTPADPAQTVLAGAPRYGLVTSNITKLRGDNVGTATDEPLHTISAQGTHHAEVRAFLIAYYGTDQAPKLGSPAPTIPTHDRFGLVTVRGEVYEIADIGLRMLQPRELFRAQGFPDTYIIDRGADGRAMTKTAQVRMCGNSVCPPIAKALVEANVGALVAMERSLAEVA